MTSLFTTSAKVSNVTLSDLFIQQLVHNIFNGKYALTYTLNYTEMAFYGKGGRCFQKIGNKIYRIHTNKELQMLINNISSMEVYFTINQLC